MGIKPKVSIETIVELYFNQGLSTCEIGRRYGLHASGISMRMNRAGFKPRPLANQTSDEELKRLYFEQQMSPLAIAELCGFANHGSVCRRLRKFGYQPRYNRNSHYSNPRFHSIEHPTTQAIAWAAGIYEGEGSCALRKRKNPGAPQVSVAQKDPWLIDRLQSLFGGAVAHYDSKKHNARYYYWRASGFRARGFLLTIYKFLSPRRQQQIRLAMAVDRGLTIAA